METAKDARKESRILLKILSKFLKKTTIRKYIREDDIC